MIIYKITNNINNKIYIGQTTRTLEERIAEHKRKRNPLISKAIKKYGIENFSIEIIDKASTINKLNEKEFYYIKKYNSIAPNGYNQCEGGGNTIGYKHTEEAKAKMSEKRKGRKLTEEWKNKIGNSQKKKVINIDTGEVFNSVKEASEYYNLKDTHISRVWKEKEIKLVVLGGNILNK